MSYITKRFISTLKWSARLVNPYSKNPSRKAAIEQAVIDHAKDKGVDARGAEIAVIASTEHEGGVGIVDNHVTVDFQTADGTHITTHHVRV
ncbi:hypothetical protein BS47DRAFT_1488285 [Hydnum rufescens UP504]|uniref:Uncharacterized protein n=1 Tax=Hydnum rufescens UP504 TaxID=1448309 RepID=A0A9P6AMQ9_9AGAM|nr:hypothetical protein BS47DRAFT_1488285 [Hydnum rufescens UP504]